MDNFNLEIKDFGNINEAKINIGKINVIGGVNGSGKSTASKLLYCFLKAMSSNRNQYLLEYILPDINLILNRMASPMDRKLASKYDYTINDDLNEILEKYFRAKDIFSSVSFYEEGLGETIQEIDKFLPIIIYENNHSYSPVIRSLFETESLISFKGDAMFYNKNFRSITNYYPDVEMIDNHADCDLENNKEYDTNRSYFTEGSFDFITDVFYIDSVSIFDLDYYINTKNSLKSLYRYKEHLGYLLKQLRDYDSQSKLSEEVKDKINNISEKIHDILGGQSYYSTLFKIGNFKEDAYFFKLDNDDQFRVNISSGIQQIGIIQVLLHNNKLQPGTFLIIDEPEVNLHPEWQIKFAEILVLLAKELDIILYLNSHSPMFIEAISLFSKYYDFIDETNIYLTEEIEENNYVFKEIDPMNMGAVYENLTSPYDELDKLKAKILFKE